jgi:hypothetical protein
MIDPFISQFLTGIILMEYILGNDTTTSWITKVISEIIKYHMWTQILEHLEEYVV